MAPIPPDCPTPSVKIEFKGLFFFSYIAASAGNDTRSECRVGILSTRQDHDLYIRYDHRGQTGGREHTTLVIPHSALQGMAREILIDTTRSPIPGATLYSHRNTTTVWDSPDPTDRLLKNYPYDFGWIIDFEGTELHHENLDLKPNKLRPTLRFKVGQFYTAQLSENPFYVVKSGRITTFGYVAKITGVCIPLTAPDEQLMITGISSAPIIVPRDTTEIQIQNVREDDWDYPLQVNTNPMAQNQPSLAHQGKRDTRQSPFGRMATGMTHYDEMQIYYDDLLELGAAPRIHFIPIQLPLVSLPFVCYSGGGSVNQ